MHGSFEFDDPHSHLGGVDPPEDVGEERVVALLEDLGAQLTVQELRVRGVDRGRFEDHAVEVDRDPGDLALAHPLLDHEHDLLRPADGEDGNDQVAVPSEHLGRERAELLGRLLAARLDVAIPPVRRLEHQRLEAGEPVRRRVEQPAPFELDVAGVREVVVAIAEVEVADRRAEDVAGVVHREPDVRRDVGRLAPAERDRAPDQLADLGGVVEAPTRLLVDDLDRIEEHEGHQIARRGGAVDRALVPVT